MPEELMIPMREGIRLQTLVYLPEGTGPLLGATTLELFNLAADPLGSRLTPVPGLLK